MNRSCFLLIFACACLEPPEKIHVDIYEDIRDTPKSTEIDAMVKEIKEVEWEETILVQEAEEDDALVKEMKEVVEKETISMQETYETEFGWGEIDEGVSSGCALDLVSCLDEYFIEILDLDIGGEDYDK